MSINTFRFFLQHSPPRKHVIIVACEQIDRRLISNLVCYSSLFSMQDLHFTVISSPIFSFEKGKLSKHILDIESTRPSFIHLKDLLQIHSEKCTHKLFSLPPPHYYYRRIEIEKYHYGIHLSTSLKTKSLKRYLKNKSLLQKSSNFLSTTIRDTKACFFLPESYTF